MEDVVKINFIRRPNNPLNSLILETPKFFIFIDFWRLWWGEFYLRSPRSAIFNQDQ
jgi:hypothetical protein